MTNTRGPLHPLHAILLAFPIGLFAFAAATDAAYLNTAEIQWTNFSAWSITAAMLFTGLVLVWAIVEAVLFRRGGGLIPALVYLAVVAAMFVVGFFNALKHSQDGWSSVGAAGMTMSVICALLALVAGWLLHSREVAREAVQ